MSAPPVVVPHGHQELPLKLCAAGSAEMARALRQLFVGKTPVQIVALVADLLVGVAQGAGMGEETYRLIVEEVVRARFDRGWVFGGAPPGVEPS